MNRKSFAISDICCAIESRNGVKFSLLNIAFIVAGIVHTLPVLGVLGSERLNNLYDLQLSDPNLLLLLRHRAVLFAIVAMIMYTAAFNPAYQLLALLLGTLSMVSFIIFVFSASNINASLVRVAWVDVFALLLLWIGAAWEWWQGGS